MVLGKHSSADPEQVLLDQQIQVSILSHSTPYALWGCAIMGSCKDRSVSAHQAYDFEATGCEGVSACSPLLLHGKLGPICGCSKLAHVVPVHAP